MVGDLRVRYMVDRAVKAGYNAVVMHATRFLCMCAYIEHFSTFLTALGMLKNILKQIRREVRLCHKKK